MLDYEINRGTYAVIALNDYESLVIEENRDYVIKKHALKILDESCRAFASSYLGRLQGAKAITGCAYKTPIIVCEENTIIFFPTTSPRLKECSWISFNNIKNYCRSEDGSRTRVTFKNGREYDLNISYYVVENQIFKSAMLQSCMSRTKNKKINEIVKK